MNVEVLVSARLAFSDGLIETKVVAGGKPRYSCCLILDQESLAKCREAVNSIIKEEFKGVAPQGKDNALRDGNLNISSKTGEVYDGFEDLWYISANRAETQGPPLVLDNKKDPQTNQPRIIKDKRDEKFPQAGDYVKAKVSFFSINGKGDKKANPTFGKKVCAQLEVIQFWKEGDKFGASKPTPQGFDALPDEEDPSMAAPA
jgi:Protein of unknown function (DUF2815)